VEEKPYREGEDDSEPGTVVVVPEPVAEEHTVEDEVKEPEEHATETLDKDKIPITAFLVIVHQDGNVEAATSIPGIQKLRQASLRDVRDTCHALYSDIQSTFTARATSLEVTNSLKQAMAAKQIAGIQNNIMNGVKR